MKKRVTIKEVAKEAGVSIATVSYVINKKEKLSKETIDKVNDAIKKLNYIPDLSARSLVNKKSNLIGLVIPQIETGKHLMFDNPFYSEFISSVEYNARQNGFQVIISGVDVDRTYLDISVKRNLDGIIVMGMYAKDFYSELKKSRIPIVLVDSYFDDHYFHSVQINDRYGGYIAVKHLLKNGHRNIGLLTDSIKKEGVIERRYKGYCEALEEYGITVQKKYIFEGVIDYKYGIDVAEKIIDTGDVTAVFATADILAMGLMRGLKNKGVKIPDDMSIIGFDDTYITKLVDPGLTTVKQDIYMKGESAVELIIDSIGNNIKGKQEVILPIEILERESVKDISKGNV